MESLRVEIERFLRTAAGDFDRLALDLFAFQFEKNLPYRAYCEAQERTPQSVEHWRQIPAVPIGAFKAAELATFPISHAAAEFHSSATTTGRPSRHFLKSLTYYEAALKSSFAQHLGLNGEKMPFLILTPPPGEAPRSSLSWMMEVVKGAWGSAESQYFIRNGRLDELPLAACLDRFQSLGTRVFLLGTTIAFLSFFDSLRGAGKFYKFPRGSRLMDTGGMKTHKRQITRADFVSDAAQFLGLDQEGCINEYGMCELSSQFYGTGASNALNRPPWVRTIAIDPASGEPAAPGQAGLLRHFDLANIDSVMAIQTEDLGILNGNSSFTLLGRAPAADLKGCSLAAERFLA